MNVTATDEVAFVPAVLDTIMGFIQHNLQGIVASYGSNNPYVELIMRL